MKATWTQPHSNKTAHVLRTPFGDVTVWECGTLSYIMNDMGKREYGEIVPEDFKGTLEQCKQWCEDWYFSKIRESIGIGPYVSRPDSLCVLLKMADDVALSMGEEDINGQHMRVILNTLQGLWEASKGDTLTNMLSMLSEISRSISVVMLQAIEAKQNEPNP